MNFNQDYQRKLALADERAHKTGFRATIARLIIRLCGVGTLSCGHTYYYPMMLTAFKEAVMPVQCHTCDAYYLISFHLSEVEKMLTTQSAVEAASSYEALVELEDCETPSHVVYKKR